jgi:hypothetical protein
MNQYWENKLKEEAYTKSTLKYLNIDNMEIRKAHMVWEAAGYETVSVSKAMIKVKLLLGIKILQSNVINSINMRLDLTARCVIAERKTVNIL